MSARIQTLDAVFVQALRDPNLSMTGVAQTIHRNVPEVKHVAVVTAKDETQVTFSVLYHDRERLSVTLHRMEEGEQVDAEAGEREVERPIETYTLDVELKDGEITLH